VMKPIVKNDLATTIRTVLDQNPSNWDIHPHFVVYFFSAYSSLLLT
jgi:hypothetical protein